MLTFHVKADPAPSDNISR